MKNEEVLFITLTCIEDFMGISAIKPGLTLKLKKDPNNRYDDEAIKVVSDSDATYGYVANSVTSVARGTHSAGYIYDKFDDNEYCEVMFVLDGRAIARLK